MGAMHAFDVLGDPVRRRILELLVDGEEAAGDITAVIAQEFGISQPAVSQHLRVLREHGFASVRAQGTRRMYAVAPDGLRQAHSWLSPFERFWAGPLSALGTELARGKRAARLAAGDATTTAAAATAHHPSDSTHTTPQDEE